ncbi:MAG TPA: DUF4350 domain-containing protein [Pyrinomonadaceae bacterium]|nr:DUF4350 domain-containing protein [Pyrinomonadaceae bacterium]
MRQRLTIILTFIVIIGLLVLLNTLTYVKEDEVRDLEVAPNRSTYHAGPTGTRALHDYLNESGYKVIRWRETPERLLADAGSLVHTFVVIGETQTYFTEEEALVLKKWVAGGKRLVIIDRTLDTRIVPESGGWKVVSELSALPGLDVDPSDVKQMTENVTAFQPVQPTPLTTNVSTVMPSRFASRLEIHRPRKSEDDFNLEEFGEVVPPEAYAGTAPRAPVVHMSDGNGPILVDYGFGFGRIILLSDPYIVSNGGIRLNDNLQLALNTLGSGGLIAFDEFHQGKGITQNAFASYFAGTPVLGFAAQATLIVLLIVWTNGRRFGRPLPLPQIDRRSSLEFVASMAELQERSRAYDLAIENIYTRTRRVLARYAGMDYNSPRSEIAARVASRSNLDEHKLETLMRQCEEAINGAPLTWRQSIDLVRRLREVERDLGLRMRSREVKQAAENI